MPELPEVETVCRGLATSVTGKKVERVLVRNAALRTPVAKDFAGNLQHATLLNVSRRAKYALIECSNKTTLVIHLGMSGSVVIHERAPDIFQKHDHVVLYLSDGSAAVYNDPRRFGLMLLCPTPSLQQHALFAHLGPEPLSKEWSAADLFASFQGKKAAIKTVIMDQQVVVGVGNIYASEALFEAGIHPARPAASATKAEAKKLHKAIRNVLEAAIKSGGSTLRDYVRSSGEAGYFQHHFRVYDKESQACETCGTPISSIRQAGRSSFYCNLCQK